LSQILTDVNNTMCPDFYAEFTFSVGKFVEEGTISRQMCTQQTAVLLLQTWLQIKS